jgi:hypothetical protein
MSPHHDFIWNKIVPLKVSVFVWRLFSYRFLTKNNLYLRGCLYTGALICPHGCGGVENLSHLFLTRGFARSIWNDIMSWLRVSGALPNNVIDFARQFCGAHCFRKDVRMGFQAIWLATF